MGMGAAKLKHIIKHLQKTNLPRELVITSMPSDLLKIEKRTHGSEFRTEFSFVVRIERSKKTSTWWPIQYSSASGDDITSETHVNGRTLVNLQKQAALVDLAETWARTLEAQVVTKTVGNALL